MNLNLDPILRRYCDAHSTAPSTTLDFIERATNLRTIKPYDATDPLQGRILSLISLITAPKYIVEVGTFTGYAITCLAEGLDPEGKIITIERQKGLLESLIEEHLNLANIRDKIEVRYGQALDILPTLPDDIDIAFIDAAKKEYAQYFDILIHKMRPGGLILADNTLWKGKVLYPPYDSATHAIDKFNKSIAIDERVQVVILPYRDGLSMIRKK